MSEQEHQYQGRQSALQVFNEFAGGVGGVEQQQLEDDEDEVEQERGEDEKKLQNEKQEAPQRPQRVNKLTQDSSSSGLKRQSSWKRFKETVKETLTGWKGGGHESDEIQLVDEKVSNNSDRKLTEALKDCSTEIPIKIEVPQRSKSVKVKKEELPLNQRSLRSSLKETKGSSGGLLPQIVVTKEDGRLATPSPKMPVRKRDSFCTSLPDVTSVSDSEKSSSTGNDDDPEKSQFDQLSHKQVRQAIIDAARSKTRQRAVRFQTIDSEQIGESSETTTTTTSDEASDAASATTTTTTTTVQSATTTVRKTAFTKRETQSLSNPDITQNEDHEGAKLAVMKIRAAIANMAVSTDTPIFGAENIIVRRRLSSEETISGCLKPTGDQVAQRSSSVDFTLFPGQRKDFLMAASIVSAERSGALLGGSPKRSDSIKRVDSIKRSDSMKRTESMKRKKARPMIWDHFDDVPHTSLQGRCKVCHMTVSCKFNTGHFVRHLQLAHREVYLSYQNKMQSNWTRSQLERSLK